jgi:hypothetical protein
MEEASTLSVLHGDLWVTTAIDNLDDIPVGLRTVCHDAFEVGLLHAIFPHQFVEFSPHNTLDHRVLGLHVIYGNGHYLAIRYIIHVTCHCSPLLYTLDMVKYEPRIL